MNTVAAAELIADQAAEIERLYAETQRFRAAFERIVDTTPNNAVIIAKVMLGHLGVGALIGIAEEPLDIKATT